jgi:2-hydroxy-3-oxopropionate reductase
MATPVGFIGLGNIGRPMAINLTKAGFDLMVYDLRAEPMRELTALGAKASRSADEVGAHGEVIEVVVVDDAQVEAALLGEGGVFSGAKRGSIIVIHGTVHPSTVRRLAELAAAKGLTLIDAEFKRGRARCNRQISVTWLVVIRRRSKNAGQFLPRPVRAFSTSAISAQEPLPSSPTI